LKRWFVGAFGQEIVDALRAGAEEDNA
jgi:hypothetical protein